MKNCTDTSDCERVTSCYKENNNPTGVCLPWPESIEGFNKPLIGYSIFTCILCGFILIFAVYLFVRRWKMPEEMQKNKWNVITQAIILIILGTIVRIVISATDPQGMRKKIEKVEWFFFVTYILWLYGTYLIFLYWVQLVHMTQINHSQRITKMKPYLYGIMALIALTIFPCLIWYSITPLNIPNRIATALVGIFVLIAVIMNVIYGYRLSNIVRSNRFKKKLLKMLGALDILALINIGLAVTTSFTVDPWLYLGLNFAMRFIEFGIVSLLLVVCNGGSTGIKTSSTHDSSNTRDSLKLEVVQS